MAAFVGPCYSTTELQWKDHDINSNYITYLKVIL